MKSIVAAPHPRCSNACYTLGILEYPRTGTGLSMKSTSRETVPPEKLLSALAMQFRGTRDESARQRIAASYALVRRHGRFFSFRSPPRPDARCNSFVKMQFTERNENNGGQKAGFELCDGSLGKPQKRFLTPFLSFSFWPKCGKKQRAAMRKPPYRTSQGSTPPSGKPAKDFRVRSGSLSTAARYYPEGVTAQSQ